MSDSKQIVRWSWLAATFALFLALIVVLQWSSGGFDAEFGASSDAASHFITGLMVRDYLVSSELASPMDYASNYYLHYPKVAMGHWPPFFYVVEAVWLLLFPSSTVSLMLLMAALGALLATTISEAGRREFSAGAGLALGALAASAPLILFLSRTVMADNLVAALVFLAALAYARYLETGRSRDAALFGLIAAVACLTKGVALFLALMPPLATAIRRDFRLFKRISWWIPALIVTAACAPWYLLAPGALHGSADLPYGLVATLLPLSPFETLSNVAAQNLGWWFVPFVVIGVADRIVRPLRAGERVSGIWAANAALVAAFVLFAVLVQPAREPRQFVCAIPPLLMFLGAGAARVLRAIPLDGRWKTAAVAVAVVLATAVSALPEKETPVRGYGEVARRILSDPVLANSVLLVCADGLGEGSMIAELARREHPRPSRFVLRGTKSLSRASWSGGSYKLNYSSPERVLEYLERIPVGLVVMDSAGARLPHHDLLRRTLASHPERFVLKGSYAHRGPPGTAGGRIDLFRVMGQENKPPGRIQIDMTPRMGRIISN